MHEFKKIISQIRKYFDNIITIRFSNLWRITVASKCILCGAAAYGAGCKNSTNGLHKHNHDETRCIYCGSRSYGNGCLQTPTRKHMHGHGAMKCIWCGSIKTGMGCEHSPTKSHET